MPGLYLYAIADSPLSPHVRGIFGRPLRSLDLQGVHAIVETSGRAPRATVARLRAQDRVLRQLSHLDAALLPSRFGTHFAARSELERAVAPRRRDLRRALRRVRGCVQMTVRLFPSPAHARRARKREGGAEYLRRLAREARAREAHPDLRRVRSAARRFVRAERVEWHDGPTLVASVYHLVPRATEREYLAALARLARSGRVKLLVSGPWLSFAFAEELR
jgi:hypothetical protein